MDVLSESHLTDTQTHIQIIRHITKAILKMDTIHMVKTNTTTKPIQNTQR